MTTPPPSSRKNTPMTTAHTPPPLLLTPEETARELSRSVDELAAMRARGEGPTFYRLGGRLIRYAHSSVIAQRAPDHS
jgi:hypothetical protein